MEEIATTMSIEDAKRRSLVAERIVKSIPGLDLDISHVERHPTAMKHDRADNYETIAVRLAGLLSPEQIAELVEVGIEV